MAKNFFILCVSLKAGSILFCILGLLFFKEEREEEKEQNDKNIVDTDEFKEKESEYPYIGETESTRL